MTDVETTTALKLSELKNSIDVGMATVKGSLDLLLQRQNQSDKEVEALKQDVEKLKARKCVTPGALATVSGLLLTALGVLAAFLSVRP